MAGTPSNSMNLNSTVSGLVNWNGVALMSSTALTQYSTLSAASSNTVNNIDPGSAGQVLTSNGASAQPTYQTPGSLPPNSVVQLVDDFICGTEPGNLFGWNQAGNFHPYPGTATNPGICQLIGGTSGIYFGGTQQDNMSPADSILIGNGSLVLNFVIDIFALSDDTDTYAQYTGIFNTAPFINLTGFGPDSGVYFQYTNSVDSGNWQIVVNNNGTSTVQDSGVPATTGFHNYGISINATATSATFFIDGVQVGTPITTNFPVDPIAPGMVRVPSAGTDPSWLIDLFYMTLSLTTPR